MKKYIAIKNCWFKEGTEAKLIEDYYNGHGTISHGLYEGIYIVGKNAGYDIFWHNKGHKEGDEVVMTEVCGHDEFNVIEKLENMPFAIPGAIKMMQSHFKGFEIKLLSENAYRLPPCEEAKGGYIVADIEINGVKTLLYNYIAEDICCAPFGDLLMEEFVYGQVLSNNTL